MARRGVRNVDPLMIVAMLGLVTAGMVMVYSASQVPALPWRSALFGRQLTWLVLGLVALLFTAGVPFRVWEEYSHFIYGLGILMLIAVLLVGPVREGARRWIVMAGTQFQPSEMAKLATVMLVARLLAKPRLDLTRLSAILPVVAVGGLPFLLILLEPDLGTSLSLPAAVAPMLFWAGFPFGAVLILASPLISVLLSWNLWVWLGFIVAFAGFLIATRVRGALVIAVLAVNMAAGAGAPILWNSLHPYQQDRVRTFLDPEQDPADAGYQVIQSKIALGSGGWTGKGFLKGTQKGLAFLPEQHTDFIFAVLGEEFGFLGCLTVLLLFGVLIQRSLALAVRTRSRYGGILVVGIASMIMFHVAVNVAMTVGFVPVTGLPLPFISYGGTFLLTTLAQCGLIINVALRRNEV